MTKRVVIAVLLFSVALLGSVSANRFTLRAFEDMKTVIERTEENNEKAEKLLEIWKRNKGPVSVFLKHTDADTLERYFELLEIYKNGENDMMFRTVLYELEAFIEVIARTEKLKFENIF